MILGGLFVPLTDRLLPHERESSVVFKFVPTDRMVLEVVKSAQFILDEVKAEDSVLETLFLIEFDALVAAAGQQGVNEEDGDA